MLIIRMSEGFFQHLRSRFVAPLKEPTRLIESLGRFFDREVKIALMKCGFSTATGRQQRSEYTEKQNQAKHTVSYNFCPFDPRPGSWFIVDPKMGDSVGLPSSLFLSRFRYLATTSI